MVFIVSVLIFCALAFTVMVIGALYKFIVSYMRSKGSNRAASKRYLTYAFFSLAILVLMLILFYYVSQNDFLRNWLT